MAPALPIIAAAMTVAGTGVSMYSQYASGKEQARVSEYNAQVAEQNAKDKMLETSLQEDVTRRKGRAIMGTQRAGLSEAGVFGAPATAQLAQSAQEMGRDVAAMRLTGQSQASSLLTQASIFRAEGKMARSAAKRGMLSSLLSGGAQLASMGIGK